MLNLVYILVFFQLFVILINSKSNKYLVEIKYGGKMGDSKEYKNNDYHRSGETTKKSDYRGSGETTKKSDYRGSGETTKKSEVKLLLGGPWPQGPKVNVTKNGEVCKSVEIPDVPKSGRTGSYATAWDKNAMVCGGYGGGSPPFSTYKDCQILNLATKTWSLGPQLLKYTASSPFLTIKRKFYIFGGSYPTNPRPGPTVWKQHDIIQKLDLNNLQEGWHVVKEVMDVPDLPDEPSTLVVVPSKFFSSC